MCFVNLLVGYLLLCLSTVLCLFAWWLPSAWCAECVLCITFVDGCVVFSLLVVLSSAFRAECVWVILAVGYVLLCVLNVCWFLCLLVSSCFVC